MQSLTKLSNFILFVSLTLSLCAPANAQSAPQSYRSLNSDEVIPPNFRGQITYEGDLQDTTTRSTRASRGEIFSGRSRINLEFDGDIVSGTIDQFVRLRRDGILRAGRSTISGTRSGSTCNLVSRFGSEVTGVTMIATCTMSAFSYNFDGNFYERRSSRAVVEMLAQRTVSIDYAARDRRLAQQAAAPTAIPVRPPGQAPSMGQQTVQRGVPNVASVPPANVTRNGAPSSTQGSFQLTGRNYISSLGTLNVSTTPGRAGSENPTHLATARFRGEIGVCAISQMGTIPNLIIAHQLAHSSAIRSGFPPPVGIPSNRGVLAFSSESNGTTNMYFFYQITQNNVGRYIASCDSVGTRIIRFHIFSSY